MSGGALPATALAYRVATPSDVPAMAALINGFAAQGLMLPKSLPELFRNVREYRVAVGPHGGLMGCGGLRVYTASLAEVVGLAVAPEAHGMGIGATLVQELVADAGALGMSRVFAMTLRPDFFRRLGFRGVARARLPEKTEADCRGCARRVGCPERAVMRVLSDEPDRGPARRRILPVVDIMHT